MSKSKNVTPVTNEVENAPVVENAQPVENAPVIENGAPGDTAPENVVLSNDDKLSELRGKLKRLSLQSNDLIINDAPIEEIEKLEAERSALNTEIKKLQLVILKDKKEAERSEKLKTHLEIINVFASGIVDRELFFNSYGFKPEADELKIELEKINKRIADAFEALKIELTKSFDNKIVIHAPQGMTGTSVKKELNPDADQNGDSKAAQIMVLIEQGLKNEDIIAQGYKDGTVRYQRWLFNKKNKATA
jgi:hypothetical protein